MITTLTSALNSALDAVLLSFGVEPPLEVAGAAPGRPALPGTWVRLPFVTDQTASSAPTDLAVGLSPGAAARLTAAMTGVAVGDQDAELQRDMVAELANILAGNLQPLMPGTVGLRLPAAFDATQAAAGLGLRFDCGRDGQIEVRMLGVRAAV